ncbi:MAG: methyltransferase [Lentimicrobium sp.]|nr:methyltransferase [Lentimicrobium sp.]
MSFIFKQFSVEDTDCSMKVGTDAVLLGAWVDAPQTGRVLDIGTGCGLLAIMVAQRSEAMITAIEIDQPSAAQAHNNFINSPWSSRMDVRTISLQNYAATCPGYFNLIITNPPFFVNSLKTPHAARSLARHNDELPFSVLAAISAELLSKNGILSLILPIKEAKLFHGYAVNSGLYMTKQLSVTPLKNKPPNRMLMEFSKQPAEKGVSESLTIRNIDGTYTDAYKSLTKDFYLNF